MRNRKNDIERYLRGELSAAEMHALEKEALNDPFLAEALEGIERTGAGNFLYDLHKLNTSVRHRTRKRKSQNIKIGWTIGIAATVLLVAVSGFLVVSLLKDQSRSNLAMKEETVQSSPRANALDSISNGLRDEVRKTPSEKETSSGDIPPEVRRKAIKPKPNAAQNAVAEKEVTQPSASEQEIADKDIEGIIIESPAQAIAEKTGAAQVIEKDAVAAEDAAIQQSKIRITGAAAKKDIAVPSEISTADTRLVEGHVVSSDDGQPLPGVNIKIEGTNIQTVTDADGKYRLSLPQDDLSLVFAFVGFESTEIPVGEKREINVQLEPDMTELSEVVVVGYGVATDASGNDRASFRQAAPAGGRNDFRKYLATQIGYPEAALKNKAEGKVTIRFTVQPTGQLTDFEVLKGIGYGCEEELIRIVKAGPSWKPSTENDQPVKDQVKIRFRFELPDK